MSVNKGDFWSILGIEATQEIATIKKAYSIELKRCHPEDNPEGFQKLREAYEAALKECKLPKTSFKKIENEEPNYKIVLEENQDYKQKTLIVEFMDSIKMLCNDAAKRVNVSEWVFLLEGYSVWDINTRQKISRMLIDFLQENHVLPYNILVLLNDDFRWVGSSIEILDFFYYEEEILSMAKDSIEVDIRQKAAEILYRKADTLYHEGVCLMKKKKYIKAAKIFKEIVVRYKKNESKEIRGIVKIAIKKLRKIYLSIIIIILVLITLLVIYSFFGIVGIQVLLILILPVLVPVLLAELAYNALR